MSMEAVIHTIAIQMMKPLPTIAITFIKLFSLLFFFKAMKGLFVCLFSYNILSQQVITGFLFFFLIFHYFLSFLPSFFLSFSRLSAIVLIIVSSLFRKNMPIHTALKNSYPFLFLCKTTDTFNTKNFFTYYR